MPVQEPGQQMSPWAVESGTFSGWSDVNPLLGPPTGFGSEALRALRAPSLPHSESDALIHAIADDIMNEGVHQIPLPLLLWQLLPPANNF